MFLSGRWQTQRTEADRQYQSDSERRANQRRHRNEPPEREQGLRAIDYMHLTREERDRWRQRAREALSRG